MRLRASRAHRGSGCSQRQSARGYRRGRRDRPAHAPGSTPVGLESLQLLGMPVRSVACRFQAARTSSNRPSNSACVARHCASKTRAGSHRSLSPVHRELGDRRAERLGIAELEVHASEDSQAVRGRHGRAPTRRLAEVDELLADARRSVICAVDSRLIARAKSAAVSVGGSAASRANRTARSASARPSRPWSW